ncbi:MAG: hypothetical protein VX519_12735 [Myxococcota bacterium]|nr:hypothetical protein [Myxococcota bacterium]
MSQNPLDPRDAALVDQIQKSYTAPSMSTESQRAFDQRLQASVRRVPKSRNLVSGALLAAAAILVWIQIDSSPPAPHVLAETAELTQERNEAYASLLGLEGDDLWASDVDTTMLPDSYQQLSSLFLTP